MRDNETDAPVEVQEEDAARYQRLVENRQPYKGPINRPCSACSAGDTEMEYHDHDYVGEKERRPYRWCIHCAPDQKGLTMYQPENDDWCYCQCHAEEIGF